MVFLMASRLSRSLFDGEVAVAGLKRPHRDVRSDTTLALSLGFGRESKQKTYVDVGHLTFAFCFSGI